GRVAEIPGPYRQHPGRELRAQVEIVDDRDSVDQRQVLMDKAAAQFVRALRGTEPKGLAIDMHAARVRYMKARQNLDERRFSGAVGPHQRMNLPGAEGQAERAQCLG